MINKKMKLLKRNQVCVLKYSVVGVCVVVIRIMLRMRSKMKLIYQSQKRKLRLNNKLELRRMGNRMDCKSNLMIIMMKRMKLK
jgi:hypothetical protein